MTDNNARLRIGYWMGAILIAILLITCYVVTWRNLYSFKDAIDTCAQPFCDFATFYYPMGEAIFQTGLPLKGFVYSPFIAILFAGFPLLGFDASILLWGALQAIVIILYLFAFRRLVPARLPIQLLFVALVLSSFTLLQNLSWGQVGIITTVSVLGALVFLECDRRVAAAALIAFAAGFKFFPFIFIMPFIFRRDLRFVLCAVIASGLFFIAVPCLVLGIVGTLNFYTALLDSYRHFDWVIINYNSQHFPHVLARLMDAAGINVISHLPLLYWTSYGIVAVNLGFVFGIQRAHLLHASLWSVHLIFLSIPFFLKTSWPVDLVYLPFGQTLLAWNILERDHKLSWKHLISAHKLAAFLLLTSIIVSNIFFFNFIGDKIAYGSAGFIFWATLLLLVVTYIELLHPAMQHVHAKSNRLEVQEG